MSMSLKPPYPVEPSLQTSFGFLVTEGGHKAAAQNGRRRVVDRNACAGSKHTPFRVASAR